MRKSREGFLETLMMTGLLMQMIMYCSGDIYSVREMFHLMLI